MRKAIVVVAAMLASGVTFQAGAGPKAPPAPKAAPEPPVRYFNLSLDIFPDLNSEAYLKEMRQGSKLVSAELDVCHAPSPGSNRRDRFVVPLKVEGDRLVGSGQSQEGKTTVAVNLLRSGAPANANYEGTIRAGNLTANVQSMDNVSIAAEDFADLMRSDDVVEVAPKDFTEFSPQVLNVRVLRARLPDLLNALRPQNVVVMFNSLETSCPVLRSGQHIVRLIVDPDRAAAVLAAIRAVPNAEAGHASGSLRMDRAVQFPSAGWRSANGSLERTKLADTLGGVMAKALGATVEKSSWDERTGQLSVVVKRPQTAIAGVKLHEVMTITLVIAPEAPGARERSVLWVDNVSWQVVEDSSGPRLEFQTPDDREGEGSEPDDVAGLTKALAAALKGRTWDVENSAWR